MKINTRNPNAKMDLKTYALLWTIKCLMVLYDIITFPIYFIFQQPWKKWIADRTIWAKPIRENDPYSPCVRLGHNKVNQLEGINTMHELFRRSVERYGPKKCMGVREVISEGEIYYKTKSVLKQACLGEYQWHSYIDVDQRVETLSNGMLQLGLQPKQPIIIFSDTRMEWMLVCLGCFRLNVPVATLYATLGEEAIVHGINETDVTHIFTSQDLLPKLKNVAHQIPVVTHIIYFENIKPIDTTGFPDKVSIQTFSQLEQTAASCYPVSKPDPPGPNDLAILMYTSGSTGIPKGVKLTHKNMIVTAAGLSNCLSEMHANEVYIGYLPLAHVLEITAELFFFFMGVSVGYSSPYTLTDKGTGLMSGCKGDAKLLKPTIMAAVPLMLDRIRKGINEVVNKKSALSREFFNFAISYKLFWYKKGFSTPILNRVVFKEVKELVGGKVRFIAAGGAPISPDTQNFIRMCLDVKILQAYAMTETAAGATIMGMNDYSTGLVGAPLSSCYIRLVDWPEGNYYVTDKPNPRGEVVVGGDCVSPGYFKNSILTDESFKEEDGIRWFYSGDIGERYPNGTYKIIDRKKDLVKLQTGEYIPLGKVEAELKTCALVDNICVVGNGFYNYLVALINPNLEQIKAVAKTLGKENMTIQEMCQDPVIIEAVTKAIYKQGQISKLPRIEIPTKVKLCAEEWHPDTGLVTAAFKIRRKVIEQFYQSSIDDMYNSETNDMSKST